MRRRHRMPFGAELHDDGRTRFRVWAPAVDALTLVLDAAGAPGGQRLTMTAAGDGWWELTVPAPAGSRYRFLLDDGLEVPDPASRFNPDDVHRASEVVDPLAYDWSDGDWRGRPWPEVVIYELHVGTFSPDGTFAGVETRLDHLVELGITAIELMPVADFPGERGWGYDGVLPYAPDAAYGRPDDLKRLIDSAHRRGLMVLLDVVYNHFGPEGNYLHRYAPDFFTDRFPTPWGVGIDYAGPRSRAVRDFFIHNALYWIEEFHLDGLRLDAVHAITDPSDRHVLEELAVAVRDGPGRERPVHLILENDANQSRFLGRSPGQSGRYDAQWNDDLHHAFHVLLAGERDGYYADYATDAARALGRCLAEGFAYQGEPSAYRDGELRGEPSADLRPTAFVTFLQTHDQVGNRAFGERLSMLADDGPLRAATLAWLLSPSIPMLFMGEEFGAKTPFLYFCDFGPDLSAAVREGRRREFGQFARFADPAVRDAIPDPIDPGTLERSRLDWACLDEAPHARWRAWYRHLLALRAQWLVPRLSGVGGGVGRYDVIGEGAVIVRWRLGDGSRLVLRLNLGNTAVALADRPAGEPLACEPKEAASDLDASRLPAGCAAVWLDTGE